MIVMEMGLPQARIRGSVASNGHSDTVAMRKQCAQRVCSTHLTTLCSSPLYPSARGACRQPAHRQVHAAAGFFALRMLLVAGAESPELGELLRQLSAMILTSDHGPLRFLLCSSFALFPTPLPNPRDPVKGHRGGCPGCSNDHGCRPSRPNPRGRPGSDLQRFERRHGRLTTIVVICCSIYDKQQ